MPSNRAAASRSCRSRRTSTIRTRSASGTKTGGCRPATCRPTSRASSMRPTGRRSRSPSSSTTAAAPVSACCSPPRTRGSAGHAKNGSVAYEFKLPDLGEGLTEGEIARWLVSEGQEIAEDDPLVEIQTDKTTVEIPSPAAGKVSRILVEEGKVVPVGTVLVVIGGDGDGAQPGAETPSEPPPARGRATPLVRKIAQEVGVELDSITGTGPQGRITEEDVRAAA